MCIQVLVYMCGMVVGTESVTLSNHISLQSGFCDHQHTLLFLSVLNRQNLPKLCHFQIHQPLRSLLLFCLTSLYHLIIYDAVNPGRPRLSNLRVSL